MPVLDGIGVAGAICSVIPLCNTNRDNMEREFDRWHEQAKAKGLDKALESLSEEVKKELFGEEADETPENASLAKDNQGLIDEIDEHIAKLQKVKPEGGPGDQKHPDQRDMKGWKKEIRAHIKTLEGNLKRINNKKKAEPIKQAIERGKQAIERWGGDVDFQ